MPDGSAMAVLLAMLAVVLHALSVFALIVEWAANTMAYEKDAVLKDLFLGQPSARRRPRRVVVACLCAASDVHRPRAHRSGMRLRVAPPVPAGRREPQPGQRPETCEPTAYDD
jgi:hypothetical protein